MPSGSGRKRTDRESKAFKSEIIELRGKQKSIVEIAKHMRVTKQYVSRVLIEAGQGIRTEQCEKRCATMRARKDDVDETISRLEKHGEYSLANSLRIIAQRRKR
jgi:hypothetical protein